MFCWCRKYDIIVLGEDNIVEQVEAQIQELQNFCVLFSDFVLPEFTCRQKRYLVLRFIMMREFNVSASLRIGFHGEKIRFNKTINVFIGEVVLVDEPSPHFYNLPHGIFQSGS